MTVSDWKIEVRDKFLNRVGELDDYQRLEMRIKFNDISTWSLTIDRRNRMAAELCSPGAGIVVIRNGSTVLSGTWIDQSHDRQGNTNTLTLSGEDDVALLKKRLAFPDPDDITPPYTTQATDVRTGLASTVMREFVDQNASTNCPMLRRIPNFVIGGDIFAGPTVTGTGRWQPLFTLVQEMAEASAAGGVDLGFTVRHETNSLVFRVYPVAETQDDVRFSFELGNLAGFSYKRTAPTMTYAIVGGDGEGTARTIVEKSATELIGDWGRIESELVDGRNTVSATELSQLGSQALAEQGGTTTLAVTPIDTEIQKFGFDYTIGCKATVVLDGLGPDASEHGAEIVDIIREIAVTLDATGEQITPAIGTTNASINPASIFKTVRSLTKRVRSLERQ